VAPSACSGGALRNIAAAAAMPPPQRSRHSAAPGGNGYDIPKQPHSNSVLTHKGGAAEPIAKIKKKRNYLNCTKKALIIFF